METSVIGDEDLLDYVIEKDFEDTVSRIILVLCQHFEKGIGKGKLSRILKGRDRGALFSMDPEICESFGRLYLLSLDEIMDFLESLIRMGMLEVIEPDFPRLVLTRSGEKAIRSRKGIDARIPWPLPSKQVEYPSDMSLFDLLRDERNRIAREEGVPPYCVATNRSLVKMVNLDITDIDDLMEIPGMGRPRVEKYGQILLETRSGPSTT